MIQFELPQNNGNIIKVIGVGGGGGNAVNHMYSLGIEDVDFIVCNTDMKALAESPVPTKIQLGPDLTNGLGAGAKPQVGKEATTESLNDIQKAFGENTKMVFVTAGMGGGTGTGGAPIVAKLAKESGALTVGIVTTPFSYEGKKRKIYAEEGIEELKKNVDTLLIISNDKVRQHFGNVAISEAFSKADDILATAAKCITDVISSKGHIIVDFADVCTVMRDGGRAILGSAKASGANRAAVAVEEALNSPLLNDHSIQGAQWILLNVNSSRGDFEHTLDEMELIQAFVQEKAGEECDLILGMGYDESLKDQIGITIVATGFKENNLKDVYDPSVRYTGEKVVHDLNKNPMDIEGLSPTKEPKNISDKVPFLGNEIIDYTPTLVDFDHMGALSITAMGLKAEDEILVEEVELDFLPTVALNLIEEINDNPSPSTREVIELNLNDFNKEENVGIHFMDETSVEASESVVSTTEIEMVNNVLDLPQELEKENVPVGATIELFNLTTETIPSDNATETKEAIVSTCYPDQDSSVDFTVVEKSSEEMENEYVTIKGITLKRKKGIRVLTDYELEVEANFELQKRAFDERAAMLRSMSYDVNKANDQQEDEEVPAYVRRQQELDAHPHSSDEVISGVEITSGKNNLNSNVSTLNNFLHGNNPD